MKSVDNIQNELQELVAHQLMDAPRFMPFVAPNGYFEHFGADIQTIVGEDNTEQHFVQFAQKTMPYRGIPDGYFNGLATDILIKAKQEDLEPNWGKVNPYKVPHSYFEQLPQAILKRLNVNYGKRIPIFRTVQLAASIALIIFVGLGALRMNQQNSALSLDALSKSDIEAYVHENIDDFDTDIVLKGMAFDKIYPSAVLSDVSNQEIEEYLNEEGLNQSL